MRSPTDAVISDFSSPAAMSNFRVNADKTLSKRDGYYKLGDFGDRVRGAYAIDDITYTVIGSTLFKLQNGEFTRIGEMHECSFTDDEKVSMFCNADILYIIGGGEFYYYNILEDVFSVYQTYSPLILKNATPQGTGEPCEAPNILSAHRKIQYNIKQNTVDYFFPETVESIEKVYLNDTLITADYYRLINAYGGFFIQLANTELTLDARTMIVEYVSGASSANLKRQYLSNANAFLYSDEDETRLFLYGKNTNGKIMLAIDRNKNSSPLNPSIDYIPDGSYFSLIDGNLDIYKILRCNDAVICITSNCAHQILKRSVIIGEEETDSQFYSKILNLDFSTTEKSGIVISDEVCYSFSNDGLLTLSYNEREDAYSVKKLEIPNYMRPNRNFFSEITLHFNKIRDELWCCCNGDIAVYNMRHHLWYKYTGINADFMFIYNSQTAFSYNGAVYLFDENVYTDNNVGFDAVYESSLYDLGNIFKIKTVFGFGAVIENIYGTTLNCTLKNDKDAECNIVIIANRRREAAKFVKRVHARLGACYYVTLRMESPAGSPPAHVKSIMFSYR